MPEQYNLDFLEYFVLSGMAAGVSKTAAAPIELVKLLMQNQGEMLKSGRLDKPYKGVIDCTMRTYQSEGMLPFWRGNMANVIRFFPTQALNIAFKGPIKALFGKNEADSHAVKFSKNIASGGLTGTLSLMFVYSLDYARTRLANDIISAGNGGERQFNGLFDVYRKTIATDGIKGLYRGFLISAFGIFLYRAVYFWLYDKLKPIVIGDDAGLVSFFAFAYVVTICSGILTYPVDTIRRRMMMTSGEAVKYKDCIDCALNVIGTEGFMSLMKGAGANFLRGTVWAVVLGGADLIKDYYIKMRLA